MGPPLREEILLRRRMGGSLTWGPGLDLSLAPAFDEGPALYVDNAGHLHLAWTRRDPVSDTTDVMYRRWDGHVWLPEERLDRSESYHPAPYGLFFVPDAVDRLCLFVNEGSGVTHTCLQEDGWENLAPWVYVWRMRALVDIVLGPDGLFHVATLGKNEYDQEGPCDVWLDDAYYTTTDGRTWAPLQNLSHFGSIAYDIDLAFDPVGRLHFLWSDIHSYCSLDSRRSAIYERVRTGGTWGERREVTPYNDGQAMVDLALTVDATGGFHLAWSEGVFDENGRSLKLLPRYCSWTDGACSEEQIVWGSSERCRNIGVTVSAGMVPAVVWQEGHALVEEVVFSERRELFRLFFPWIGYGDVDSFAKAG